MATSEKASNILDPIHDELSPFVWMHPSTPAPVLHRPHHKFIIEFITKTLNEAGYKNTQSWLSLVLTGSLTTYQYGDQSDCDISLFIDGINPALRGELIGVMVSKADGTQLPGTPFPLQCYVVPPNVTKEKLYKQGLRSGYDINSDKWIVPPDRSLARDIEKEMNNAYVHALQICDKMDMLLRYEPQQAVWFWNRLHKKRQYAQRAGLGDYSLENITYKMLSNRGLIPSGQYE